MHEQTVRLSCKGTQCAALGVDTLLPNSSVADDTEVKNVMGGKVMTKILTVVKPELDEVFKFYRGRNEGNGKTMDLKEFTTLLQHINVMGGRLVRSDLDVILGSVQTDDDAEANIDEFIEMLLVVSMHLNPNPYIPVTKRFMAGRCSFTQTHVETAWI